MSAEPLTEEELATIEADLGRPDDVIHGRGPAFLRRLLATIRARDEEIDLLRRAVVALGGRV